MAVFDINMRDTFPMPTLEQGSPFGGVLSNAIAKRLAMANAKKAEAEVPYAGLSSLANAMSKGAYATGMPIQNIINTMKNDKQWANMTPNQQAGAIAAVYNQAASQSGLSPIFNSLMQKELTKLNDNQKKSSIFESIKSLLGMGSDESANPSQPMMQNNANATQPQIDQQPKLPITSPNLGDTSQAIQNEANYKQALNQAGSQGTALGDQSAKQMQRAQDISTSAQNMDQLIDSAVSKYRQSWFKGPGLGKFAKYGPDAAQALKDTNAMAVAMADQLFGAGSSDAKQASATTLKLNMEDPEKTFEEFSTKMKAQNDRLKWQGTFYQTANQLGVTNPSERDQLWFEYNAKHPPYDYKKHEPIYENLGLDQNQMVKFITQQKASGKLLNKKIESTLKNPAEEFNKKNKAIPKAKTIEEWHSGKAAEEARTINGKHMLKIGGKWYEEE